MTTTQKQEIKTANDNLILKKGYRICDWLPILETQPLRTLEEIKGRMSVMNGLINIAFGAPTTVIKNWIADHKLTLFLSKLEREMLEKENGDLTGLEVNSLHWYLESLWALMWATRMIDTLDAEAPVGDHMASLLPNLEQGEDNTKLAALIALRPEVEMYTMLDSYFRLHWYCVDERLNGRTAKLNEGLVLERRKALEWAYNRAEDWDQVDMNT